MTFIVLRQILLGLGFTSCSGFNKAFYLRSNAYTVQPHYHGLGGTRVYAETVSRELPSRRTLHK